MTRILPEKLSRVWRIGRISQGTGRRRLGRGRRRDVDGDDGEPGDAGSEDDSSSAPGTRRLAEMIRQPVSMPSRRKRTRLRRNGVGGSPSEASWSVTWASTSARSKTNGPSGFKVWNGRFKSVSQVFGLAATCSASSFGSGGRGGFASSTSSLYVGKIFLGARRLRQAG